MPTVSQLYGTLLKDGRVEPIDSFLGDRRYGLNVSLSTLKLYQALGKRCLPLLPEEPERLTQSAARSMVAQLTEQTNHWHGKEHRSSDGGINVCIRTMNAFFRWGTENGYFERDRSGRNRGEGQIVRVPQRRVEKTVLPVYSEQHLSRIMEYRPSTLNDQRVRTLFILAADTGCRISELTNLQRDKIDFEKCNAKVYGKGRKERMVPFSPETRRIVLGWLRTHEHDYVFPTRTGTPISVRNAERDLATMLKKLGIPPARMIFHAARRTFATAWLKNGGDLLTLQQVLGHADLDTTRRYLQIDTDILRDKHASASPLARIGKGR
jgi:integrase/recombinase XerD